MSDIRLIEFKSYVRPDVKEYKNKGWVLNGDNNSFYTYIIERNKGSVTNGAINGAYAEYIYGRGISAKDASLKTDQWASFVSMLSTKELKKIIADFQVFGEAAMQVVKAKDRKKVAGIYHLPKQMVAPGIENEEGEIESYWYCKDWTKQGQNKPEEFPAFNTSSEAIEIYVINPYSVGCSYFSDPDYIAGLPYAEMEEEMANFSINAIKNGLSAGYIINVPDGQTLTPDEKNELERKIKAKLTGSPNAQKFILNFASKDAEITVVPFPVNEQQHKQWDTLTETARQQLMTAHRVVSPMLFGIKDNTGLGNNADELDTAEAQMMKRVIQPKQQYIIDALKEIVSVNGITLDLYFKPLTEQVAKVSLSVTEDEKKNLDTSVADELIKLGEDVPGEEWELIETVVVHDYDKELKLTSTGTAIPNAKSVQDGEKFKTRYRYVGSVHSNTREFCRKMIAANKIYRIEDINRMSSTVVNEGWGPGGSNTYDIFLYKGGGNCKHAWQRETYQLKADVNNPLAEKVTPGEARKAGEPVVPMSSKAATPTYDMLNHGFLTK